jgi:hypothetical protein
LNGDIKHLIDSSAQSDLVSELFGPGFQTLTQWRQYLRSNLNPNASAKLGSRLPTWSTISFQALYVACWVHHPVEKGSYMIDLSGLTAAQLQVVRDAYKRNLKGRASSHLSGSGRSASAGWSFLKGYHELLVQLEVTAGIPHLFLKAEGHTTGLSQVIPHLQSWRHKKKTGEGLQVSPFLNAAAEAFPSYIEARAAENYGKGYKALVKLLGLSGRQQTVRDVIPRLFRFVGYPKTIPPNANNFQLGSLLNQFCDAASHVRPGALPHSVGGSTAGAGGLAYRRNGEITQEMIDDLRELAGSLIADGQQVVRRVYRELRLKPVEIDQSLANFYT